jgi:hypothetical protein
MDANVKKLFILLANAISYSFVVKNVKIIIKKNPRNIIKTVKFFLIIILLKKIIYFKKKIIIN